MKFVWLCFNTDGVNHPVKNYYTVWYDGEKHHYDEPKPMATDDFGQLFELKTT